uniref:Immunoglobulin domain-containing protein n=1 Tax=Chrysemys picta bellii TaxID=8478 RepID=A0A8C3HUJ2_CHRPI
IWCLWSDKANRNRPLVQSPAPHPRLRVSGVGPSGGVSLGGAMTVQCRGQHQGVQFVLNKERRHFPPVDSDRFEVVFPISNVRREHGGSYSCSYHSRSEPFAVSYPSDPMELVVRGEGPGSASPFPAPPPARPSWGLCANGMLLSNPPSLFSSAAGSRGWVGARVWFSQPCLLCADPNLPRPSISLSPTGVTAPGADVTIWCQGQYWYVRFFLHKAGDLNPQRHMDPAGDTAEFHIPNVGRQHGGNYSCSYRPRSEPFVSSQPSDPVELVVAGEGPSSTSPLPAPLSEGRHPQSHPFLPPLQGPAPIPPMALPHSVPPPLHWDCSGVCVYICVCVCWGVGGFTHTSYSLPSQPQEPDRLTYAELDGPALQAKRGCPAPVPKPAHPSVYTVIKVRRGAPQ